MKKGKIKIFKMTITLSLLINVVLLNAQVIIESAQEPQTVLQRELISKSFNGDCDNDEIPYALIPVPACSNGVIAPAVKMMQYNLGANPAINTPKKQMAYLASKPIPLDDSEVYGDLYQWGRAADGHQLRTNKAVSISSNMEYDDITGQITGSGHKGFFVYNDYDWRGSNNQRNDLWGNGEYANTPTPNGGVPNSSGVLYQMPVKTINDPCPVGWRIPTEDEWERLCRYDCDPANANVTYAGNIPNIRNAPGVGNDGATNNNGLIWVPVRCNATDGKCYNDRTDWNPDTPGAITDIGGYAIYKTEDWNTFYTIPGKQVNLIDPSAPEPVLFLPAAGYRSYENGSLRNLVTRVSGFYWSSTSYTGTSAYLLYITGGYSNNDDADKAIVPANIYPRASGFSIRCVADESGVGTDIPVADAETLDVRIFSPAPGKINILAIENLKVRITDVLGRTIGTYNINDSSSEISVPSGIYIVNVENKNKIYTQKVIVN